MAKRKLPALPDCPFLMRVGNRHILITPEKLAYLCGLQFDNRDQAEDWLYAHGYTYYRRLGEISPVEAREVDPDLFEGTDEGESIRL